LVTLNDNLSLTAEMVEKDDCVVYYEAGTDEAIGSAPSPACVKEGNVVILEENTFERDGYNFEGWMAVPVDDGSLTDSDVIYMPGYPYPIDHDVTMVAVWSNKATLVIDSDMAYGTLGVIYNDTEDTLAYTTVNGVKVYYLDPNRTIRITATPDTGYELVAMRYRKGEGSNTLIPFESNIGTLYIESGYKGVYTLSASFMPEDGEAPVVSINQEVWYGSVKSGGTTINNCAIVYVKVQLPLVGGVPVAYDSMTLRLILTRNQVWAEGKTRTYNINLTASDFDDSGFYTAGIAVRRRDLDNTVGVTADGYIMNATLYYTLDEESGSVAAPQSVEFACGKQAMNFEGESVNGNIVYLEEFGYGDATFNASEILVTSGINHAAIKWNSSDTSIASVSASGVVTMHKQGAEVTITASAGENRATVLIKRMGMSFVDGSSETVETVVLGSGENVVLTPSIVNANGYELKAETTYGYSIEDGTVASISVVGGKVTVAPEGAGITYLTVTATLVKGESEEVLTVKVSVYVVDGATEITANKDSVKIGEKINLTVTASVPVSSWTWTIVAGTAYLEDDITVVNANAVSVTGRAVGTATITAVGRNAGGDVVAVATKNVTVMRN